MQPARALRVESPQADGAVREAEREDCPAGVGARGSGNESGAPHAIAVPGRLPLPATVNKHRVRWSYAISIVVLHALALLAFMPALFTWTGLGAMLAGCYVFGTLGV